MSLSGLPALNAFLNGLSAIFLTAGYCFIRRKQQRAHQNCMLAACVTSALFLVSYITYHVYVARVLHRGPTIFRNPAWFRPFYLAILLTHTILAVVILPMVIISLSRALRQRYDTHRRIARWTFPLWMYVSVTGVLIYLLLYQVFPQL
jgi:putative membrane protein